MNIFQSIIITALMVGMVWTLNIPEVDNSLINAGLYSYLGANSVDSNDTDVGRWGSAWGEPPSAPSITGPGSPIAKVVTSTIQTLNLLIPILTYMCTTFASCAGLVGPESYLGRFWAQFLSHKANPIANFLDTVKEAIAELITYANNHGIQLIVGTGP